MGVPEVGAGVPPKLIYTSTAFPCSVFCISLLLILSILIQYYSILFSTSSTYTTASTTPTTNTPNTTATSNPAFVLASNA